MDLPPVLPPAAAGQTGGLQVPVTPTAAVGRVREACRSFEAYFTASVLSSLTQSTLQPASGSQGQQERWAWDWLAQTVADEMSRNQGLGLARQLEIYIKEKSGPDPAGPAKTP